MGIHLFCHLVFVRAKFIILQKRKEKAMINDKSSSFRNGQSESILETLLCLTKYCSSKFYADDTKSYHSYPSQIVFSATIILTITLIELRIIHLVTIYV